MLEKRRWKGGQTLKREWWDRIGKCDSQQESQRDHKWLEGWWGRVCKYDSQWESKRDHKMRSRVMRQSVNMIANENPRETINEHSIILPYTLMVA